MEVLPIMLRVEGRACLVVGAGTIAARKAEMLLRAGARVTVVAPEAGREVADLAREGRVSLVPRAFLPGDLDGMLIAIAAADDAAVNAAVSEAGEARGVAVNVVDRPELCRFLVPALVERGPITIAISTGGASPVLARRLRAAIETAVPAGFGRLAAFAGRMRRLVADRLPDLGARRRFWDGLLDGAAAELVMAGREAEAEALLRRTIGSQEGPPRAFVHFVGAGPGDPDLVTLKALRTLQQADVILHDPAVPAAIVELARRDAERIALEAHGACPVLLGLAGRGLRIVRLLAGDAAGAQFSRDAAALTARGIAWEIVPGVAAPEARALSVAA